MISNPSWDSRKLLQFGRKKKGGLYGNFHVKRQIHGTAGLSIRNIAEKERAKANPERMNPEPVNGYMEKSFFNDYRQPSSIEPDALHRPSEGLFLLSCKEIPPADILPEIYTRAAD